MRQRMTPKLTNFSREKVEFDLTGMDRKSIKDILHVCRYGDEDSNEYIDFLTGQKVAIAQESDKKDFEHGGGFEKVTVESDFIKPYLDRLLEWTGYAFAAGAEIPIKSLDGIFHTHGVLSAKIIFKPNPYKAFQGSTEGPILSRLIAETYTHVYLNSNEKDIDEKRRAEKAEKRCVLQVAEELGQVQTPREFIEVQGGLYKRNPDYGSGRPSPINKGCYNENVWQEIFGFWFENFATAGQKEIIARMSHCWEGKKAIFNEKYPSLRDYGGIHLDNYCTYVKIEDFKASKVPPVFVPKPKEPAQK